MGLNYCYRPEEMINSDNSRAEMTAEQILKEIEALPESEREPLVQRMRESAGIPQDFIDALDAFNQQLFVSMETARACRAAASRRRKPCKGGSVRG